MYAIKAEVTDPIAASWAFEVQMRICGFNRIGAGRAIAGSRDQPFRSTSR